MRPIRHVTWLGLDFLPSPTPFLSLFARLFHFNRLAESRKGAKVFRVQTLVEQMMPPQSNICTSAQLFALLASKKVGGGGGAVRGTDSAKVEASLNLFGSQEPNAFGCHLMILSTWCEHTQKVFSPHRDKSISEADDNLIRVRIAPDLFAIQIQIVTWMWR